MAVSKSKSAVVKAIVGNAVVTVAKSIAWVFSGSGALLAETVHSLVDTLNQCLLLVGYQRSQKEPTKRHPYGFGVEESFWGLLAAIGILVFGGGISIQHGVHALLHPKVPDRILLVLALLAFSTVIESWVLWSVLRVVGQSRGKKSWLAHIKAQPPGTITVILEDSAAVGGCLLAATAVWLSSSTGNGIYDALAQLMIGAMLALVGLYLIWTNRGSLIGLSLPYEEEERLRMFIADLDAVDRVVDLKTRMLSAYTYRVKAEIVFSGGEVAGPLIPEFVRKFESTVAESGPPAEFLGRFADALFIEQARHLDQLEEQIHREFPGARHIDLEPHLRDDHQHYEQRKSGRENRD